MSEGVGILTHRDADGICSAALAKSAYPDADVKFAEPFELASKMRTLPSDWSVVIILDLGIGLTQKEDIKNAFEKASKSRKIIYIDHHSLLPGITRKTLHCDVFVHRTKVSNSELALEFFRPPASLEYIALLGAISDYQEHTRKMRELIMKYGWRTAYLETFLLEQGLEASRQDHPFKRNIIQGLIQGLWPSGIPGLIERARSGIKQEGAIKSHVKENISKFGERIALVTDLPFMATGKAATYAVKLANTEVGIGTYRNQDYVRLSVRRDRRSRLNLNSIIQRATFKVGGNGGGHETAVGGRVPVKKFNNFLKELERYISKPSSV